MAMMAIALKSSEEDMWIGPDLVRQRLADSIDESIDFVSDLLQEKHPCSRLDDCREHRARLKQRVRECRALVKFMAEQDNDSEEEECGENVPALLALKEKADDVIDKIGLLELQLEFFKKDKWRNMVKILTPKIPSKVQLESAEAIPAQIEQNEVGCTEAEEGQNTLEESSSSSTDQNTDSDESLSPNSRSSTRYLKFLKNMPRTVGKALRNMCSNSLPGEVLIIYLNYVFVDFYYLLSYFEACLCWG